jgi:signal transduction histidine kinase
MLNVAGPEWRELDGDDLNLLRTIGDMLGVAVERARLHARRLDSVQAEERNRLAREIHDTIAQDLAAMSVSTALPRRRSRTPCAMPSPLASSSAWKPDRVRLTIEDDGKGFAIGNADTGNDASRFGLMGMRERARLLGGSFQIESSPGAGTRVTAEVPLSPRSRS